MIIMAITTTQNKTKSQLQKHVVTDPIILYRL